MNLKVLGQELKCSKMFDIIKSTILNTTYDINKLNITNAKGHIHIYHSYNNKQKYSGRWYNTDLSSDEYVLNSKNKTFVYTIPEYEDNASSKIKKNVKVTISFTADGYDKFVGALK